MTISPSMTARKTRESINTKAENEDRSSCVRLQWPLSLFEKHTPTPSSPKSNGFTARKTRSPPPASKVPATSTPALTPIEAETNQNSLHKTHWRRGSRRASAKLALSVAQVPPSNLHFSFCTFHFSISSPFAPNHRTTSLTQNQELRTTNQEHPPPTSNSPPLPHSPFPLPT
jgi:hypothetical protein